MVKYLIVCGVFLVFTILKHYFTVIKPARSSAYSCENCKSTSCQGKQCYLKRSEIAREVHSHSCDLDIDTTLRKEN